MIKFMLKILFIILSISHTNLAFASDSNTNSPNQIAINVIEGALLSLKTLKDKNSASTYNIEALVLNKLMPNVNMDYATKLMLGKHWGKLNDKQKIHFKDYVTRSIVNDYVGLLKSYKNIDDLNISVEPGSETRDNEASVKLHISFNKKNEQYFITLKMVKINQWLIYDAVFPGLSMLEYYKKNFNSIIKRKGLDGLIATISNN